MELYTLVSLIIGIFGATYAALNALRVNFEGDIKNAVQNADSKLEAIVLIRGDNNRSTAHCRKHRGKILSSGSMWTIANALPAITFFLAVLFIGSWVLYDWDIVTIQHSDPTHLHALRGTTPWCWFRCGLTILGILDILCVGVAIWAWIRCKTANGSLLEHFEGLEPKAEAGLENPKT